MFHFSRRTLWIIIYITIPLIFVLNRFGQNPEPTDTAADSAGTTAEQTAWSLDAVTFERDDGLWSVQLPGSALWRLTVVQTRIPTEDLALPAGDAIRTSRQGGRFLVTVTNPANARALRESVDFLRRWLPDGDDRAVVLSGDLTDEARTQARRLLGALQGEGVANEVAPRPALTRLTSPPMGTPEQLAFLLWIGVLEQRLRGYDPQIRWDHRDRPSAVLINQTLDPDLFRPVTAEELEPVRSAYRRAANERRRTAVQIHRYLVTTAVYRLPTDFLRTQPERLAAVTLDAVNRQRQRTQGAL